MKEERPGIGTVVCGQSEKSRCLHGRTAAGRAISPQLLMRDLRLSRSVMGLFSGHGLPFICSPDLLVPARRLHSNTDFLLTRRAPTTLRQPAREFVKQKIWLQRGVFLRGRLVVSHSKGRLALRRSEYTPRMSSSSSSQVLRVHIPVRQRKAWHKAKFNDRSWRK